MIDAWTEMLASIMRHKLRTGLTALSVAWGIFMLVALLAAGRGLQNGVQHDFRDNANNAIWVRQGTTSLPHEGLAPGRPIQLDNGDVEALQRELPGVEYITGRYNIRQPVPVRYRDKSAFFPLRGVHPDHQHLELTLVTAGRFINERDVLERRKVAAIGTEIKRVLFGNRSPLGEFIQVRGINYRVIGVYTDEGSLGELKNVFIPVSTAQLVYHGKQLLHQVLFTVGSAPLERSQAMAKKTLQILAKRHRFSPDDRRAIRVWNSAVWFEKINEIFRWLRAFLWVVGFGTLLAGSVGVSNIMLISVRERTLEIGVRKAVGATPLSIVWMVLQEAIFVTSVAGVSGLIAAALGVELLNQHLPENDYVRSPEVDFEVGLIATGVLVLAGALAGILPALRAANVKPVVAMRGG